MTDQKTQIAILQENQKVNTQEHKEIKEGLLRIECKLDNKADNAEFIFWRNLLVTGILLSIFIGVVANWIK